MTWHFFNSSAQYLAQAFRKLGLDEKRCAFCLEPFQAGTPDKAPSSPTSLLCPACKTGLEQIAISRCTGCGLPLAINGIPSQGRPLFCASCLLNPPAWQGLAYYGAYGGKLRDLLLALKYSGKLHLVQLFADLLLEVSACLPRADLLIPVPLSRSRLKKRGFNQALEIAKCLSGRSGIPFLTRALWRLRDNPPQEGLNAEERRKNVRGVFQASDSLKGAEIWLLDDVMTTGATLSECCNALLDRGAKRVSLLFVARTLF